MPPPRPASCGRRRAGRGSARPVAALFNPASHPATGAAAAPTRRPVCPPDRPPAARRRPHQGEEHDDREGGGEDGVGVQASQAAVLPEQPPQRRPEGLDPGEGGDQAERGRSDGACAGAAGLPPRQLVLADGKADRAALHRRQPLQAPRQVQGIADGPEQRRALGEERPRARRVAHPPAQRAPATSARWPAPGDRRAAGASAEPPPGAPARGRSPRLRATAPRASRDWAALRPAQFPASPSARKRASASSPSAATRSCAPAYIACKASSLSASAIPRRSPAPLEAARLVSRRAPARPVSPATAY